jgi:hypothetical protein
MQFILLIAVATIAIHGSANRYKTMWFIVGYALLGGLVGGGIGYAIGTASGGNAAGAAGSMTGVALIVMGLGASIKKILENRKVKPAAVSTAQ